MFGSLLIAFFELPYLVGDAVKREPEVVDVAILVEEEMGNAKALGIKGILLQAIYDFDIFYYPTNHHIADVESGVMSSYYGQDVLEMVLSSADQHNLDVYVGLGRDGDKKLLGDLHSHKKGWKEVPDIWERIANAAQHNRLLINEIEYLYGSHKSLAGYYISHETGFFEYSGEAFYNKVADHAHLKGKPVMISPAFVRESSLPSHCEALKTLNVDLMLYQDRVGDGAIETQNGIEFTFDHQLRIDQMHEYLYGLSVCHEPGTPQMGTNIESWRRTSQTSNSIPATPSQFQEQLGIAAHYGVVSSYVINGMTSGATTYPMKQEQRGITNYRNRAEDLYNTILGVDIDD